MMIHQTWAYAEDSTHKDFKNYGNDQMKMYSSIMDAMSPPVYGWSSHGGFPK